MIFIVDAETDTIVTSIQGGEYMSGLFWTHDDQHIVSMSRAGLQVWDSDTGDLLYSPTVIEPRRIALHPFNNQLFYFDSAADVGVIVDISTLIDPTQTHIPPTLTDTPTHIPATGNFTP